MIPKIYIAGPYTQGDVAVNVRTAIRVADWLAEYGAAPFVPHLTHFWHMLAPHDHEFWLEQDIHWLRQCDALYRIDGASEGAEREVALARELGLPVFVTASAIEKWIDAQLPIERKAQPERLPYLTLVVGEQEMVMEASHLADIREQAETAERAAAEQRGRLQRALPASIMLRGEVGAYVTAACEAAVWKTLLAVAQGLQPVG